MTGLDNLRRALAAVEQLEHVKDLLQCIKCDLDDTNWNSLIKNLEKLFEIAEINI